MSQAGIQLCDGVSLTHVGVRLNGVGSAVGFNYEFGLFGELSLDVPGSTLPLLFDYEITECNGQASLNANLSGNLWKNAFGTGLSVSIKHHLTQ